MDFLMNNLGWMIAAVVVLILLIVFLANYIKVPPNVALIVSGRRKKYKVMNSEGQETVKKFGYRIVRGGATFTIPFFERVDKVKKQKQKAQIYHFQ